MKSDIEIRDDVIRELRGDPQISDPDAIGVAVKEGAARLTGHTSTFADKGAALRRRTGMRSQGSGRRAQGPPHGRAGG
jgi:hypothetical protein